MPTILPRSAWTKTPNARAGRTLIKSRVNALTLHYPASGNVTLAGATKSQVASRLEGYRKMHVGPTRGWADIGYNYAVDGAGRIWFLTGLNVGSHAGTAGNPTSVGVLLVLGDKEKPTNAMIESVRWLRAEILKSYPNAKKVQGHRQVPGNSTACPGTVVLGLINAGVFTKAPGTSTSPAPAPAPKPKPSTSKSDPAAYFLGAHGSHVTWLGERLVAHLKALGIKPAYTAGPGPTFTATDRAVVRQFQLAQGWTGADADGFPGKVTLQRLAAAPKTPSKPVAPKPATTIKSYRVKKGDTLGDIAAAHKTTVSKLAKLNGIRNANVITVGQVLKLR